MFAQIFASFTRIAGFVEALSTSSFTALHSSANFWNILLKFSNFFLICSFHKNHRFSWGLSYLPVYWFSLTQWIFIFVIFCNCMQTWTYLCILIVYTPIKQKPKKVGNKLGKTLPFLLLLCFTIHWQGSVYWSYLVKCSSNPYLKMPGLCVQQDPYFV